ncbi:MAG: lipoprotein [Geminicoccaceae bacterium]
MRRRALLGLVAVGLLAACGRRGPLRLPDAPPLEEPPAENSIRSIPEPEPTDDGATE